MTYEDFEALAWDFWDRIPASYKEGVDGLVVENEALPHPSLSEVYTLGECLTETYPSGFSGPDTTRSALVLYYGSFLQLAQMDADFDWRDELWETLTHELRHHLEWLCDEDALEAMDYAADEGFKRHQGHRFDPFYYRAGEQVAEGVYRVEGDFFLEREFQWEEPGGWLQFDWHGNRYRVAWPDAPGDVSFMEVVSGVQTGPAGLTIVLVRRQRLADGLRALLTRKQPVVLEAQARAELVEGA